MTPRRIAPIVGLAGLAVATLAGCEKPYPGATVWSGTHSDHREAQCWSFDAGTQVDARDCLQARTSVGEVPVTPGSTIGISVDPALTEDGWFPAIGDQRLTTRPLTTTYFRFALSEQNLAEPLELRILALGEGEDQVRGLWLFELSRSS